MTEDQFNKAFGRTEEGIFAAHQIQVRLDDAYIINSLGRCGVDSPTTFSLVWGTDMAYSKRFPPMLEKIVLEMIQEEEKKRESYDSDEQKLHQIVIDLLQVMYKAYVTELVKLANA